MKESKELNDLYFQVCDKGNEKDGEKAYALAAPKINVFGGADETYKVIKFAVENPNGVVVRHYEEPLLFANEENTIKELKKILVDISNR